LLVKDADGAGDVASSIAGELRAAGVRVELDARTDTSFGRRSTDWELKGVPLRVEVGPRDLADGNVTVVWRHAGRKEPVAREHVVGRVRDEIDAVQQELLAGATAFRDEHTADCSSIDEVVDAASTGFARVPWSVVVEGGGEPKLAESAVTVRCLQRGDGTVPEHDDEPDLVAFCARAY